MEILSGFILGILGSLHCVGMCGPIALAIPHKSNSKLSKACDNLSYNFGRVLTYTALGAILGLAGSAISFSGIQEKLSIIIGVLILLVAFGSKYSKIPGNTSKYLYNVISKFKSKFSILLRKKGKPALLGLGILNGLLPCGLVYVALAAALGIADVSKSILFMAGFGFGTIPALFTLKVIGNFASPNIRQKFSQVVPYSIAIVGVLMILRGMSLGVPYVSPDLSDKTPMEEMSSEHCH